MNVRCPCLQSTLLTMLMALLLSLLLLLSLRSFWRRTRSCRSACQSCRADGRREDGASTWSEWITELEDYSLTLAH